MSDDAATSALARLIAEALAPTVREAVADAARGVLQGDERRVRRERLLTPAEVAKRLSVCQETVYRMIRKGRLRAVTSLGLIRFCVEDVEAIIGEKP